MLARDEIDDVEMLRVAEVSGTHSFMGRISNGYDLQLTDRGEGLSGGQRQAISLARALAGRPQVIVFDEPTSAMDHSGEEAVKKRLADASNGKTLLVITHRSSLFELISRIIVIDGGKVVADGNKEQVIDALRTGKVGKSA